MSERAKGDNLPKVFVLAIDDSGTRHPDRKQGRQPAHGHDWFGLGGILFDQDVEDEIRKRHAAFCSRWPQIQRPLHSSEIRAQSDNFRFLHHLEKYDRDRFYEELYDLMRSVPVIGHACVIDRPGYNARYHEKYGRQKWSLCKSAFMILVERSAKIAAMEGAKLRVFVERSDKSTDRQMQEYYSDLKENGAPFATETSGKYNPLAANSLGQILYEFRVKYKTSPLMQLADLFLWPMCIGGYDEKNRTYRRLFEDQKLVDNCCNEYPQECKIKYYCFDGKRPG